MGMGKTLSILALLLETMAEGRTWAAKSQREVHAESKIKHYTHSTLVVVPSACRFDYQYAFPQCFV